MTTEIKFKTKRQSICRDACGTVRTGACGESFVGKFRCSYKSNCSSENYCICSVRAFCKKNTIQKQVYEKTISFRARSRLVPRVMITSEPTTPEPDTPDYGALSTPEPDRQESETPTIPEPRTPDTPEQEDNKTKSRLEKRKKIFKAFRSMLLPRISATPEPDTPVSGKPTSPEPDTPESVTPTTQDPGTPEIVESKGDIKIKKNDRTKSKLEKVRKLKNFILCTYNNMTMVISKHFRRSIFRKSFAKK